MFTRVHLHVLSSFFSDALIFIISRYNPVSFDFFQTQIRKTGLTNITLGSANSQNDEKYTAEFVTLFILQGQDKVTCANRTDRDFFIK